MEYAAVIIPTLNRREHLKRCVDSLLRNKEASETEVYISVDYPPSEKYEEGYQDVKEYVKTITGFKDVYLFYQEKNLGPGFNRFFLMKEAEKTHSTYIFMDDDNEFSPNFLGYMNWALNTFRDDPSIYAVCAVSDYPLPVSGDYVKTHSYTPYGAGYWFEKGKQAQEYLNNRNIEEILHDRKIMNHVEETSSNIFCYMVGDLLREVPDMRGYNDKVTYIDIWENVYCIVTGRYNILPVIPKSRNFGNDGSGVHAITGGYSGEIDSRDFWPEEPKNSDEDNAVAAKLYKESRARKPRTILRDRFALFSYRHFSTPVFNLVKKALTFRKKQEEKTVYYG